MARSFSGSGGAARRKIELAATGPRQSKRELLMLIGAYILATAAKDYNGVTTKVPCPSLHEWHELSSGCRAVLPSVSQLNLYADGPMRAVAAKRGTIHEAYFAVAQYLLKQRG